MTIARRFEDIHLDILDEDHALQEELLAVLGLKKIASGVYRNVYETISLPNAVFKIEAHGKDFCNIVEWKTWIEVKDGEVGKWFAPCLDISYNGGVLIMEKVKIFTEWPKGITLPDFFQDRKPHNFGRLRGQVVCVDYPNTLIMERAVKKPFKLVPPVWP